MKHFLLFALALQLTHICPAQVVMNVRAVEEDGTVMILYDLYTLKAEKEFFITVKTSKDKGKVFAPLYDIAGDANKNVKVGTDHTIIWNPLKPFGDSLTFKVEAETKRSATDLINPNEGYFINHPGGSVGIERVVRVNSDVDFVFYFKNHRSKDNTFVAYNFAIVDEKGQVYSKALVSHGEIVGSAFTCDPEKSTKFIVRISNVPDSINSLQKVSFALSEIPVYFSNVKIEK